MEQKKIYEDFKWLILPVPGVPCYVFHLIQILRQIYIIYMYLKIIHVINSWWPWRFDPHFREIGFSRKGRFDCMFKTVLCYFLGTITFVQFDHEIFSMAILSLKNVKISNIRTSDRRTDDYYLSSVSWRFQGAEIPNIYIEMKTSLDSNFGLPLQSMSPKACSFSAWCLSVKYHRRTDKEGIWW